MKKHDQNTTDVFFNTAFTNEQQALLQKGVIEDLHYRDKIFIERILPRLKKDSKILDFGCGQGRLLSWLVKNGFDASGIERNEGMLKLAKDELGEQSDRVSQGTVDTLAELKDGSYDVVIIMGVFQYLSEEEYVKLLKESFRILQTGGTFVCTFQNAFFDFYTFNKYTIDSLTNKLLFPHIDSKEKQIEISGKLKTLLTFPEKPEYSESRARDNVFVRLSNPLTMEDEIESYGFKNAKKYYYEYFGLPPIISQDEKELAQKIKNAFEVKNAESWQGLFMANAFLMHSEK